MISKIISVFVILVAVNFIQYADCENWKGTRGNVCDPKYDIETRKTAYICAINAGLNLKGDEEADLKGIFTQCNKKFGYIEDGENDLVKSCEEHANHGGPRTACMMRALNPTKVNPKVLKTFRQSIDSECFKGFTSVEDTALTD